jgi:hypothetical protein
MICSMLVKGRPTVSSPVTVRVALAFASLLVAWAVAELVFRHLVVESHAWGQTLASQRWMERYWRPINRYGLRDEEYKPAALAVTRRLFVLGDSYAAGQGVADVEDRFGNILRRWLGPAWSVVVMADRGWDTEREVRALTSFPWEPHVLVWSWFINDILGAADRHGRTFDLDVAVRPSWLAPVVERSYVFNYVYWNVYLSLHNHEIGTRYIDFLRECYADPRIWSAHQREMMEVVRFARERDATLLAVVFADLGDPVHTRDFADQAAEFLESQGVETLEAAELFAGRDIDELVVNAFDHHPSEAAHRALAEAIYAHLGASLDLPPRPTP